MLYDRLIAAGVTYLFPGSRAVKLVKDSIIS